MHAALTGTALAAFPDDPPSDPAYDPADQGDPASTCQQRSLFGVIPQCTPTAQDAEDSAGMFIGPNRNDATAPSAWREFTTGNDETLIAYIEGGINWQDDPEELANRVFINRGELPSPTTPVNDGVFNAADFADSSDANGNGLVDPEDIIAPYSDDDNRAPSAAEAGEAGLQSAWRRLVCGAGRPLLAAGTAGALRRHRHRPCGGDSGDRTCRREGDDQAAARLASGEGLDRR